MGTLQAFTARWLVDGAGRRLIDHAVVVRDGRIDAVHPISDPRIRSVSRVDFGDATILPGLIDAHVHSTFPADGSSYESMLRFDDDTLKGIARRNSDAHLRSGVTTMRDNGARNLLALEVRRESVDRGLEAPRMLVAGPPVTRSEGHMHWCGGTADGSAAVRRRVISLAEHGVDHIKLVASGGGTRGTSPFEATYTGEELKAAVDAAREARLRTAAHCHAVAAIRNALDAGVDCLEHASFLVPSDRSVEHVGAAWAGLRARFDARLAERIARQGTYVSVTLLGGYRPLLDLETRKATVGLSNGEQERLDAAREHVDRKALIFRALLDAGLREQLVISTDAGPADTEFGGMHLALRLAVQAGMSPVEAIESATRIPAAAIGLENSVGRLVPGLEADMVVARGDAAADVGCLGAPAAVIRGGVIVHGAPPPVHRDFRCT